MKALCWGVLLCLFSTFANAAVSTNVKNKRKSLENYAKSIHNPKYGKPTNSPLWFYGNENWLTYYTRNRITRADVMFGALMMKTLTTYCNLKKQNWNCLGRRVRFTTKISGSGLQSKILSVNINGTNIVSNYYMEVFKKTFEVLEKSFGGMKISSFDRHHLRGYGPYRVAKANFHVLYPTSRTSHANIKWGRGFISEMFKRTKIQMFNLYNFQQDQHKIIRNEGDFFANRMSHSLHKYSGIRTRNRVTAVVTGPQTQDAMGMAFTRKTSVPYLAMRSLFNAPSNQYTERAIAHNSQIFLHELVHNMGIGHCRPGQTSICTDNVWRYKSNAVQVMNYLKNVGVLSERYAF